MLLVVAILCTSLAHIVAADSFNNFTKPAGGFTAPLSNYGGPSWALGSILEIEFYTNYTAWSISLNYFSYSDPSNSSSINNILSTDHIIRSGTGMGRVDFSWEVATNSSQLNDPPVYTIVLRSTTGSSTSLIATSQFNITNATTSRPTSSLTSGISTTSTANPVPSGRTSDPAVTTPSDVTGHSQPDHDMAMILGVGIGVGLPVLFTLIGCWLYVTKLHRKWPFAKRPDRTSELPAGKKQEKSDTYEMFAGKEQETFDTYEMSAGKEPGKTGTYEMSATSGPHEAPTEVANRGPIELPTR